MKTTVACAAVLLAALTMPALQAAHEEAAPGHAKSHFDPKIDAWAEGVVMAVNADAGTLTVRGAKRAYATAYARMLQEIHEKTAKLPPSEREIKATEIRSKWHEALDTARKQHQTVGDGDFTFYLPKERERATFFNESKYYDRETKLGDVPATESERAAMLTLKDLKIGDRLAVGYESGLVYNTAYALIKVRAAGGAEVQEKKSSAVSPDLQNTISEISATSTADTNNIRKIRLAIVKDKDLSADARGVVIQVECGTVTLRGEVKNESEKQLVEKKAAEVVGSQNVRNQLEVAGK